MSVDEFKKLFGHATEPLPYQQRLDPCPSRSSSSTSVKTEPLPYQQRLALCEPFPSLLDIPTGLGKTAAVVLAWLWRRRFAKVHAKTPRRLIYCLPMRVLVEQTYGEVVKWLDRLGLLAGDAEWTELGNDGLPTKAARLRRESDDGPFGYLPQPDAPYKKSGWSAEHGDRDNRPIAVHLLLGGEEDTDWALWPERDAILIGTQDMLISRVLNRGYSAGRARWPLEFGLLNTDCLWVFDEIQIMDTSLATSLQLDAWRLCLRMRHDRTQFPTEQCPVPRQYRCKSLWMSATMAKHWLERAVDWSSRVEDEWKGRHQLSETELTDKGLRSGRLFEISKRLSKAPIAALEKPKAKDNRADSGDADRKQIEYLKRLADHISKPENHASTGLTLVIVNMVDRAAKLFELLHRRSELEGVTVKLIHSRFRPYEREQWSAFLNQKNDSRRILISTQVVEAGVDLSASFLYTELAPWASLVQRFGRCARYPGESGQVIWLDLDLGSDRQSVDHWAMPYTRSELVSSRERLSELCDVGLNSLATIKASVDSEQSGEQAVKLFPYEPRFVPRDKDLFDLFDTMPDLTGADVDVSRFIRDGDELDVQVFWREIPDGEEPRKKDRPQRRELCAVPFHRFRRFARESFTQGRVWRRSYSTGRNRTRIWERLEIGSVEQVVYPGQVFLLEKSCGGYSVEFGWTGDVRHKDFELPPPTAPAKVASQDDEDDSDDLSHIKQWLTILDHSCDVCKTLADILDSSDLTDSERKVLQLAARWHDRGKAHLAFRAKLHTASITDAKVQEKLAGQPPAKAPEHAWRRDKLKSTAQDDGRRPGHRHELASALAILETLCSAHPTHAAFAWPDGLDRSDFGGGQTTASTVVSADDPLVQELAALSADEVDLLVYLVASHHGKVRMSLRSSPDDERVDVPDPCRDGRRQARGVRDDDALIACQIPAADLDAPGIVAPEVTLSLDLMELGLSAHFGASWRERTQLLLERLGPFRLGYLEALLRAADCRASRKEDNCGAEQ